jgi:3-polyprenyl-4-hydroxybenzoate decarboxylase
MTRRERPYPDRHEHLQTLKDRGLLLQIDRPIDKDGELHPLVRWRFVGGLAEGDRKAFLFTNIIDGRSRRYEIPVVVGAIGANPQGWMYCVRRSCASSALQGLRQFEDRAASATSRRRGTGRSPPRRRRSSRESRAAPVATSQARH